MKDKIQQASDSASPSIPPVPRVVEPKLLLTQMMGLIQQMQALLNKPLRAELRPSSPLRFFDEQGLKSDRQLAQRHTTPR